MAPESNKSAIRLSPKTPMWIWWSRCAWNVTRRTPSLGRKD